MSISEKVAVWSWYHDSLGCQQISCHTHITTEQVREYLSNLNSMSSYDKNSLTRVEILKSANSLRVLDIEKILSNMNKNKQQKEKQLVFKNKCTTRYIYK